MEAKRIVAQYYQPDGGMAITATAVMEMEDGTIYRHEHRVLMSSYLDEARAAAIGLAVAFQEISRLMGEARVRADQRLSSSGKRGKHRTGGQ